jgi:hypothetical protein
VGGTDAVGGGGWVPVGGIDVDIAVNVSGTEVATCSATCVGSAVACAGMQAASRNDSMAADNKDRSRERFIGSSLFMAETIYWGKGKRCRQIQL